MLLSRDDFRNGVFERDDHKCVVCSDEGKDAHHIIERRLWTDEGYYLDNGVTLCHKHHLEAEMTTLGCDELREAAGIEKVVLPDFMYSDHEYDKWGNIILPNGKRVKGELFNDLSVQKILKEGNVLSLFTSYVKYPRTFHLPWSESKTNDDRTLSNTDQFEGKEVVVTVKMDGENTNFYSDYMHARSINCNPHASRSWIRSFHAKNGWNIPEGWRVCGENLFAKHSIHYKDLKSYFYMFSIWNEKNECLSWDDVIEWSELLDFEVVPVLYRGIWDEKKIISLYNKEFEGNECEGYVVRLADSFPYGAFRKSVGKFVRENHITTTHNWKHEMLVKNETI